MKNEQPYKGTVKSDAGLKVGDKLSFKADGEVIFICREDGEKIGTLFALECSKHLLGHTGTVITEGSTCTVKIDDSPMYLTIYVNYPVATKKVFK
jgi:hypothetical protein